MRDKNSLPGEKMGKKMLTLMWIGVLGALTFFFAAWEKQQYNPNSRLEGVSDDNSHSVVLKRNNMGHYVASGLINGVPVVYMLDTGATSVAVPSHLARDLKLVAGPRYQVNTANGQVEVRGTRIDQLDLGPIRLNGVSAAINPGMQGDEILLGMSVLKQLDFSQTGDELTLTQFKRR